MDSVSQAFRQATTVRMVCIYFIKTQSLGSLNNWELNFLEAYLLSFLVPGFGKTRWPDTQPLHVNRIPGSTVASEF
jgi:hypothetical protein